MPKKPPYPKLSETLPHDSRVQCNRCMAIGELRHWREHGDHDEIQNVFIVLCDGCSEELIGQHPRLYSEMTEKEMMPGAMAICDDCRWREMLSCTFRKRIDMDSFTPPASTMHFLGRDVNDNPIGEWAALMPDKVYKCEGKYAA